VQPRPPLSAPFRCRGALLPALHFEPVVLRAADAQAAVSGLVTSPGDIVLMVFPDGDVGDDDALVQVGVATNAWPNGARSRSLPLLPALRLTGVRGRAHDELRATADAVLGAHGLRRRFLYDARVIAADGAISAVFWTFESPSSAHGAPADHRRWSWRSRRACPPAPRARR
jgi:hypothetical protein